MKTIENIATKYLVPWIGISIEAALVKDIKDNYLRIINSEFMKDFYWDYIQDLSSRIVNIQSMSILEKSDIFTEMKKVIKMINEQEERVVV